MPLPVPEPGLVLSYSYLWKHQSQSSLEQGTKIRPCAITLVTEISDSETKVWVVPITHTDPENEEIAIEIPARVKNHLGLDDQRSWIILNELNSFIWPGPDLRPIPGIKSVFSYGLLPPKLFNKIIKKMVSLHQFRSLRSVKRTE